MNKTMAWNLVFLLVTAMMLFVEVGQAFAAPVVQADALAAELAPQFDVPEAALREAIWQSLLQWRLNRVLFKAAPWCLVGILIVIRAFVEWRGLTKMNSGGAVPWSDEAG